MHRLDLGLYSHPKEFFGGMEFEPMLTPREKSPLPKMSPEEDRTRDTVDSEPKHYQLSYSGPQKILYENKPRKIAGFRKGYPKADHLQQIGQLIEKCNEFKRLLCVGCIDYEKAFDSIENEALLKALRTIEKIKPILLF